MKLAGYLHEIDKAEVADAGVNAATERYHAASKELAEQCAKRIAEAEKGNGDFLESELVYAAAFRCHCRAGMAYPDGIGMHGAWYCSAILKGEADREKEHTPSHPFAFFGVKSEGQPSARGATTRPDTSHIKRQVWYVCRKCGHDGIVDGDEIQACEKCGASRYREDYPTALSDNLKCRYHSFAFLGPRPESETNKQ